MLATLLSLLAFPNDDFACGVAEYGVVPITFTYCMIAALCCLINCLLLVAVGVVVASSLREEAKLPASTQAVFQRRKRFEQNITAEG